MCLTPVFKLCTWCIYLGCLHVRRRRLNNRPPSLTQPIWKLDPRVLLLEVGANSISPWVPVAA
jgi:hypothetical protein